MQTATRSIDAAGSHHGTAKSYSTSQRSQTNRIGLLVCLLEICFGVWSTAFGQTGSSISLGWTASSDSRVVGYNLYSGVASQTYTNMVSVGNVTNATVGGLVQGMTYFFSVAAVDSLGDESPFCNEVSYTIGTNSSSSGSSSATNTAPTISAIANQVINANSATAPLVFTVWDQETPANLTVSAASSNPTLVPNSNIVLSGSGTNWTVTVMHAGGQTGTATIALTVCDPSLCTTTTFQLTVNPLPTISLSSGSGTMSYTAPTAVSLTAGVTANGHTITQVQFLNGATLLGTTATAPYVFNWTGVGAGTYSLTAAAVYDAGSSVSSAPVGITVAPPATLPAPWQTLDIGAVGLTGSATVTNSLYTVLGAGNLSGSSDSFRYLYQALTGDGEIRAQITSLQNTSANALSGVMIRESLTSGSRYALMCISPNGSIRWQRRSSTSGSTSSTKGGSGKLPNIWLRLVRTGNVLYGYKSSNGTTWTLVTSSSITMAPNICIGLVTASGASKTLTTSIATNVTVVPSSAMPNAN